MTNYSVPSAAIDEEKGRDRGLGGEAWIRSTFIAWCRLAFKYKNAAILFEVGT